MKKMSVQEFRKIGGLQEINRCFLHPRGLAIEVIIEDDGSERFGDVWDYRDDPEGIFYGEAMIDKNKIKIFENLYNSKKDNRKSIIGSTIQGE